MSLQSLIDDGETADMSTDENAHDLTQRDTSTRTVVHYRVELPPCFHGDGKDKESFSLWKTRLELAIKACADGQSLDVATILPTRLSGDALAYWLSLPPAVQQDYEDCTAKLNDVFGRKEFLLHFQTFVNARQRLPKESLEVYAAEITRLVLEAFPDYGKPAIAMERFRRFVAGLDPILQAKCHEHGATTLEDALAVACKWERAQEALKLLPPPGFPQAPTQHVTSLTPQDEPFTAMVSTKHGTLSTDPSTDLKDIVKQLSDDVRALKLEVSQLGQQRRRSAGYPSPHANFIRDSYAPVAGPSCEHGRRRYGRSPSVSPDRVGRMHASSSYRDSRSPKGRDDSRYPKSNRRSSPSPSCSPHRQDDYHPSAGRNRRRDYSPERYCCPNPPSDGHAHRGDYSRSWVPQDDGPGYESHPAEIRRRTHMDRSRHVSFTDEPLDQVKEW